MATATVVEMPKAKPEVKAAIVSAVQGEVKQGNAWKKAAGLILDSMGNMAEAFVKSDTCAGIIASGLSKDQQAVLALEKGKVPDEKKEARKNAQTVIAVMRSRLLKYITEADGKEPAVKTNMERAAELLEKAEKALQKEGKDKDGANVEVALRTLQGVIGMIKLGMAPVAANK